MFKGDELNFNVNQAAFVLEAANSDARKPYFSKYGRTQGIDQYCNCATNNYNSLQVRAEKRFTGGYTIKGNRTYQQAIDNSAAGSPLLQSPTGPR